MSDEAVTVLKDIQRWIKIIGIQEAREVLGNALSGSSDDENEELRIIYYLTNGENSTRDIARHVSIGKDAIGSRQQQWAKMGLVEKEHQRAPYKSLISLEEAGLEVPEIPEPGSDDDD